MPKTGCIRYWFVIISYSFSDILLPKPLNSSTIHLLSLQYTFVESSYSFEFYVIKQIKDIFHDDGGGGVSPSYFHIDYVMVYT